ncbi:WSD1 family O-acyltransferase, partial [Streptomyces sp. SID10244]|nr:WSD1 family O-acyltransferase [Streptomyces sp. SID10244]
AVPPEKVTGVTVVSSVYRGAADLTLGGGPVRFTTGFPALSPAQGLTHGVHGIGNAIAISVTTSPEVMPDVERYVELLTDALALVATIDGRQDSAGPPDP